MKKPTPGPQGEGEAPTAAVPPVLSPTDSVAAIPTKVTVENVEKPVHLSEETVEALKETPFTLPAAPVAAGPTPVTIVERAPPPTTPALDEEIKLKTQGQRDTSQTWEDTQRIIALSVTWVALVVAAWLAIGGTEDSRTAAFVFVYGVANLVIGFYFGRTNHTRTGGTGSTTGEGR